ncbi:MAG: hypothetical protein F6K30_09140, partial [Cyanothece sp. SIO2G6]|nr:hypothetical protein [Cyanothece sp. SIO2G6]
MRDAKEREIQLQFLDEAQDHLQTLDAALIELSNRVIDGTQINAALRAAHSMKGGGSLMGFPVLSQLSHQMEDVLKVLKVQKNVLEVDQPLETLLLSGIDCLRLVVNCDRQQRPIPPDWLQKTAQPIFDQLRDRLGEPEEENATSVLNPEEGQDIMPILFETEVDGCLNRLEALLSTPDQPCLREEVLILAQELGGLGAMLQLAPFCRLCASIAHAIYVAPDRAVDIAQLSVAEWRRSQSLVLTQQLEQLPTTLQVPGLQSQLDPTIDPMDYLATVSTEPEEDINTATDHRVIISSEPRLSFDELEALFDDDLDDDSADDPTDDPTDDGELDPAEFPTLAKALAQDAQQELNTDGSAIASSLVAPELGHVAATDLAAWADDLCDSLNLEPADESLNGNLDDSLDDNLDLESVLESDDELVDWLDLAYLDDDSSLILSLEPSDDGPGDGCDDSLDLEPPDDAPTTEAETDQTPLAGGLFADSPDKDAALSPGAMPATLDTLWEHAPTSDE